MQGRGSQRVVRGPRRPAYATEQVQEQTILGNALRQSKLVGANLCERVWNKETLIWVFFSAHLLRPLVHEVAPRSQAQRCDNADDGTCVTTATSTTRRGVCVCVCVCVCQRLRHAIVAR